MRGWRLALLFLGAALPVAAGDVEVRGRIEERIQKAKLDEQGPIEVTVEGGRAVLSGAVATVHARQQAERLALKETRSVENRLRVLPEAALPDAEIRRAVSDTILRYPFYSVFDSVSVDVADGGVVLAGSVRSPDRKKDIGERVAKVAGVRHLRNEIRVQSASLFDERLRQRLYQAIYGRDQFAPYASWHPVRIVVDRGRVTLTGTVASKVEQALLGHIAREVPSFGVENRVQVEGEAQEEPVKRSALE